MKTLLLIASFLIATPSFSKEEAKQKELVLSEENTLVLDQDFNGSSVSALIEKAKEIDSKLPNNHPIYLFLYTPGGSIQDGLELYEAFRGLNRPVHTITLFAASMGFQTVQQLGERYILRNGILMSHKAKTSGMAGEFGDGFSQLDSRYGLWMSVIKDMDEQTVKRTNGKQTLKSYRAAYENELWLLGSKAVEQGYADAVVTVKCDSTMKGTREIEINFFGMSFSLNLSKCPTNTNVISVVSNLSTTQGTMTLEKFLTSGGTFGKECYEKLNRQSEYSSYYSSNNYSQTVTTPVVEAKQVPCLIDTDITLEKIKTGIQKVREERNKNIESRISKSY